MISSYGTFGGAFDLKLATPEVRAVPTDPVLPNWFEQLTPPPATPAPTMPSWTELLAPADPDNEPLTRKEIRALLRQQRAGAGSSNVLAEMGPIDLYDEMIDEGKKRKKRKDRDDAPPPINVQMPKQDDTLTTVLAVAGVGSVFVLTALAAFLAGRSIGG